MAAAMRVPEFGQQLAPAFFRGYNNLQEEKEKSHVRELMKGQDFNEWNTTKLMECGMWQVEGDKTNIEEVLLGIAGLHGLAADFFGVKIVELANPIIPAETLIHLMESPDTTLPAAACIAANPNFPKDERYPIVGTIEWVHTLALAKHGDLTDPKVITNLELNITDPDTPRKGWVDTARRWLCEREELPEELAAQLFLAADAQTFESLAKTRGHRAIMQKELAQREATGLPPISTYSQSDLHYLTPDMDAKTLQGIYTDLREKENNNRNPAWRQFAAMTAAHPNAPTSLMEQAIQDDEIVGDLENAVLGMKSPLAETTLIALMMRNGQALYESFAQIECSSTTLGKIFDECCSKKTETFTKDEDKDAVLNASCLKLASHPNFPWEKYTFSKMILSVSPDDVGVLTCLMALRSRYPELDNIHESEHAAAALFKEKTSALRLKKIAAQDESLAPLVAMHPNGIDYREAQPDNIKRFASPPPQSALQGKSFEQTRPPQPAQITV